MRMALDTFSTYRLKIRNIVRNIACRPSTLQAIHNLHPSMCIATPDISLAIGVPTFLCTHGFAHAYRIVKMRTKQVIYPTPFFLLAGAVCPNVFV